MISAAFYYSVAAGAAIVSACAAYRFLSSAFRNRIFADTPIVRIRSAAQGYVHVQGRAAPPPGDTTTAPLTRRSCVWWDYQIEERVQDSRGNTRWHTIDRATSVAPFTLYDGDACCLVGPVGAEIRPTDKDVWYNDMPRALGWTPGLLQQIVCDQKYRYTERIIGVDAQLSVLGELRSNSAVTDVDEQVAALLVRWKSDQQTLLQRFDRNHDGRIDQDEWEAARTMAHSQVQAAGQGASLARVSVVGQTTHGEPFVITPLSAQQLLRHERLKTTLALAVSLLAVCVTVWAIRKAVHLPPVAQSELRQPMPAP